MKSRVVGPLTVGQTSPITGIEEVGNCTPIENESQQESIDYLKLSEADGKGDMVAGTAINTNINANGTVMVQTLRQTTFMELVFTVTYTFNPALATVTTLNVYGGARSNAPITTTCEGNCVVQQEHKVNRTKRLVLGHLI